MHGTCNDAGFSLVLGPDVGRKDWVLVQKGTR